MWGGKLTSCNLVTENRLVSQVPVNSNALLVNMIGLLFVMDLGFALISNFVYLAIFGDGSFHSFLAGVNGDHRQ